MPHTFVIFGASGDLTSRKLIPALFQLHREQRLPPDTRVVGLARTQFSDAQWRASLEASTKTFMGESFVEDDWAAFGGCLHYVQLDIGQSDDFQRLASHLRELERDEHATRVYYLSTAPALYSLAIAQLGAAGLSDETRGARRVVIEKPFGTDRLSATRLNVDVHKVFDERQIYRIDHYLGKETVQNLLVLRFANSIFEPLWNRNYIDHVQITVAEEVAVGRRGGYYDPAGVLRDMFQNHLLQLMMITAMEAPVRYESTFVRDEKVKVLQAVRPIAPDAFAACTLRGQYDGYLQEPGVPADSETATFAAVKLHIDNWRWKDVPFYLRSGKAMSCRTTQIVIQFREPPHALFTGENEQSMEANRLVIQIQPAEGIQLHFQTKVPDAGMRLRTTDLDFRFADQFSKPVPDAYQRLLLDAITGDSSLFARSDEVESAWQVIDPIIAAWQGEHAPLLHRYPVGLWGPSTCSQWMSDDGRQWFDVCPVLRTRT
jgi:glucose-6-phosphate 1-dehydrogenase